MIIIVIIIIIPRPCQWNEKIMKHESDSDASSIRCAWYSHHRIDKGTGGLENKRTSRDHPVYNNIKTGKNIKKSPGDLRRLAVTLTPV